MQIFKKHGGDSITLFPRESDVGDDVGDDVVDDDEKGSAEVLDNEGPTYFFRQIKLSKSVKN